ncbi:MAG: SBBP repeat-containing protein, partial [Planctomycetota bacterium]
MLDADGAPLWTTIFGGASGDWANDIALDGTGGALVVGQTWSSDFPNAVNGSPGGGDGFAARIAADGSLAWTRYLGGSSWDQARAVAVSANTAVVAGWTASDDFAGLTGLQGVGDGFLVKLNAYGQQMWAMYLGGSANDDAKGVAVDRYGQARVVGMTASTDLDGARNGPRGKVDAFLARVSPDGALQWAAYLGGSEDDWAADVAVDSAGAALVAGKTSSGDFAGPMSPQHGGSDAFVARVIPYGTVLWATCLGGGGDDVAVGIAFDGAGSALVAGSTDSTNFEGASNASHGGKEAFAAKVDGCDGSLIWAMYLGGTGDDGGTSVAVDPTAPGSALVAGWTKSGDLHGADNAYAGGTKDAFVARVRTVATDRLADLQIDQGDLTMTDVGGQQRVDAQVHNTGDASVANVLVRFHDTTAGQDVSTQWLGCLGPGESTTVWTYWEPANPAKLVVELDPYGGVPEKREDNNRAAVIYDPDNQWAEVDSVQAEHDGDDAPDTIGRFLRGAALVNTFTAVTLGQVQRVELTLGSLGTVTDADGTDGWTAQFDMGALTADQTTLTVVAYDAQGNASDPWTGTVTSMDVPGWADNCAFSSEDGWDHYELTAWKPPGWRLEKSVPDDWLVIGGLENSFQAGLLIRAAAGLDGVVSQEHSECTFGTQLIVFGQDLNLFKGVSFAKDRDNKPSWAPDSVGLGFAVPHLVPTFDEDLEIAGLEGTISGSASFDYELYDPKRWGGSSSDDEKKGIFLFSGRVPFTLGGWPMSLETSLSVSPGFDWCVTLDWPPEGEWWFFKNPTYLEPHIQASLKCKVNLVDVGAARLGAYVQAGVGFNYRFGLLDDQPGLDDDFYINFDVLVGAELKIGFCTIDLGSKQLFEYTWGQEYEAQGGAGPLQDQDPAIVEGSAL